MWHYIKFFHYYAVVAISATFILLGGFFIPLGFALFLGLYVVGDHFLGDDISEPTLNNKTLLNLFLYSSLPVTGLVMFLTLWIAAPQESLIVQTFQVVGLTSIVELQAGNFWFYIILSVPFLAFLLAGSATVVAHELVHRVGHKPSVCAGRWLMAMSFDANFSIEHVYHHHAKVATPEDPVTAPRGRNVYTHFLRALVMTNVSSWKIEERRLQRLNKSVISFRNRCIRGYVMTLSLMALAFAVANWQGLLMFCAVGLTAKFILEVVNYMEHYGLVRSPRKPVRPKHSWNTNRKISCWAMFNLPRHSHHHAQAATPFEKLKPMEEAPQMISGYISTIGIALVPPLWFKLMQPKLEQWDQEHADEEERKLVKEQSSTIPDSFIGRLIY